MRHGPVLLLATTLLTACSVDTDTDTDDDTPDDPPVAPPASVAFFAPAAALVWMPDGIDEPGVRFMTTRSGRAQGALVALAGDFDGDGLDSISTYELLDARFHLRNANAEGPDDEDFVAGVLGEFPIVGDFDGDGVDTLGLFDPATATFRLFDTNEEGAETTEVVFGSPNTFPLAGDFDGSGRDTLAVFDPATRTFRLAGEGGTETSISFDIGEDAFPFVGDIDGDGVDDLGLSLSKGAEVRWRTVASDRIESFRSSRSYEWQPLVGRFAPGTDYHARKGFEWSEVAPSDVGIDGGTLQAGLDWAEGRPHLRSVLVARHGRLAAERYYNDVLPSDPQCIKSVSKSILSATYGIAYERGEVMPDTRVADVLPQYFEGASPQTQDIVVGHLMTMTAGLAWEENAAEFWTPWILSDDWTGYVLGRDQVAAPGASFVYSTGLTHVAARVLAETTGRPTSEYTADHLFSKLGIEAQRWDRDPQGFDVGGMEVWMAPRDLARFGQLYLDEGRVGDEQVLLPEWVDGTTQVLAGGEYGAWWWIRGTAGFDTFYAWGWGGQFIFVIDDLDLVVVITSNWWDGSSLDAAYEQAFGLLDDYVVPAVLNGASG